MARRFGDAGGARCWAGEGKEEQQRVSSKLHADLARGLARACSLRKGQQRAAKGSVLCWPGGTDGDRLWTCCCGWGGAVLPAGTQPAAASSLLISLLCKQFCWSRRVGAACKHPFLLQQEGGSGSEPSPGVFPSPLPSASHRGARRAPGFGAVQLLGGAPCAGPGRTPLRGLLPNLSPLC